MFMTSVATSIQAPVTAVGLVLIRTVGTGLRQPHLRELLNVTQLLQDQSANTEPV